MKVPHIAPNKALLTANGCWKALSIALLTALSLSVLQRPDLVRRKGPPEQLTEEGEGRIMIFYHVHAMNNWREILLDQCTKLIYSGLYEAATSVYAGISGPSQEGISAAVEFLSLFGSKFTILEQRVNSTLAERLTLNRIKELTRPTDRILYIHSKGVSQHNQAPSQQVKIRSWRDSMEFFLIRHYRQCLPILRDYDLVGINWIKQGDNWPADDPYNRGVPNVPDGYPAHFSGNFWWAKASFWHSLPEGFLGPQYNEPENAMFRYNPKVACVHYDGLQALGATLGYA